MEWSDGFTGIVESIFFLTDDTFVTTNHQYVRDTRGSPHDGDMARIWSIQEKKELTSLHLKKSRGHARAIGFYGPANILVYNAGDHKPGVFTYPALEEKAILQDFPKTNARLRFSPDGKWVLAAINSASTPAVRLHNASNGVTIAVHQLDASNDEVHFTDVRSAGFSSDGKLIGVGTDRPAKVYVLTSDMKAPILKLDVEGVPDCVAFTPDGEQIAFQKGRNAFELRSIKANKSQQTYDGISEGANSCSFSPDGAWIAIASGHPGGIGKTAGKIRVFEVKTGKLVAELD